jgi:hypothetical protein
VAALAALGAAVINAGIYFGASGLGLISHSPPLPTPGGEQPLTVASVAIGSTVGAVGAAIVFALIGLFARRPVRLFRIVATVVLAISLVDPLIIPGVPVAMLLLLMVMHVVTWSVSVGLLTTLARRAKLVDA